MDINFKLNDRQNSNQLSDQIINSADEVFQAFLSDELIQKFLMKGDMVGNSIAVAHRRLKDSIDLQECVNTIFQELKQTTDKEEEKKFLELCLNGTEKLLIEYRKKHEQSFGKMEAKLANSPMTQWAYSYHYFSSYLSSKGQYLNGVVILLAMFLFGERAVDYLKQNPNYSPNIFAKLLLFEDFAPKETMDVFRQMIDSREDKLSEDERKELAQTFQRAIAYERLILNHNYSQGHWFEG